MEEDLKRCWRCTRLNANVGNGDKVRRMTALQSLVDRYKKFSLLGLMFAAVLPFWMWRALLQFDVKSGWPLNGLIALTFFYFILSSMMDRWLARGISTINLAEMSVAEVCKKAFYYRQKHLQFMAIMISLAIVVFGWIIWVNSGAMHFIYGLATGGVVGGIIGYKAYIQFMKEYKDLTSD